MKMKYLSLKYNAIKLRQMKVESDSGVLSRPRLRVVCMKVFEYRPGVAAWCTSFTTDTAPQTHCKKSVK